MRKHDVLRAIYVELRATLGPEIPAGEVIRLANLILRAYSGLDHESIDDHSGSRTSIVSMAVDTAMQDGGWRVLEFEESQCSLHERDYDVMLELRPIIEKFLGPEWKHPSPTDPQ